MHYSMPGFPVLHYLLDLLKLMFIESVMPSNHLISVTPFFSCLQTFPASGSFPMNQFFASGGQSFWSFSFSIGPSNEYSGLISFRMDWLDLLAIQRILKSLLQHHISKASILQCSAFFIVQLSHLMEKAMAPHSSTLGWKIPWTEEPSRLQPMRLHRVRHD